MSSRGAIGKVMPMTSSDSDDVSENEYEDDGRRMLLAADLRRLKAFMICDLPIVAYVVVCVYV